MEVKQAHRARLIGGVFSHDREQARPGVDAATTG
jgi:hypothetical protein